MTRHALVVDDEPVIRAGVAAMLSSLFKFDRVDEAASGVQALHRLARPVDVVITDVSMPDMTGIEFIRELRCRGSNVPVIVLSAHADFAFAREALRHGATDYLLKPVDRMELGRALTAVIDLDPGGSAVAGVRSTTIQRAIRFIERNIDGDLSLGAVAAAVSLSPQYLSSIFKQESGSTFVEHVTRVRMRRACDLLKTTDLRVYEVAQMCGYQNAKTFMTSFKEVVGVSARVYRETNFLV